ncbi:MAG: hypothetical protein ACK2US_02450 [Anaerolineae bacterium]|jgi:hypothetical protein
MIYKVSYVVIGQPHPGEIINQDEPPQVGDQVTLGGALFEVVEVIDLAPPRGDFAYLHATCQPVQEED